MKRLLHTRFAVAVTLFLAAGAIVWLGLRSGNEGPSFEGRTLRAWLEDPELPAVELRRGVRAIGTNGIPMLKQWLDYEETWLERQVRRLNSRQHLLAFDHSPTMDAHLRAMRGFFELEELAAGELDWLKSRWRARDHNRLFYAQMLAVVGDGGVAVLTNALPEMPVQDRKDVATALVFASKRKPELMREVRRLLRDPSREVRGAAVFHLWSTPGDLTPEVIAALQDAALDPADNVRESAVEGLRRQTAQ